MLTGSYKMVGDVSIEGKLKKLVAEAHQLQETRAATQ